MKSSIEKSKRSQRILFWRGALPVEFLLDEARGDTSITLRCL
jgi:hypothetical protein